MFLIYLPRLPPIVAYCPFKICFSSPTESQLRQVEARLVELEVAGAEAAEAHQRRAEDQVAEKEREAAALLAQAELRVTSLSDGMVRICVPFYPDISIFIFWGENASFLLSF